MNRIHTIRIKSVQKSLIGSCVIKYVDKVRGELLTHLALIVKEPCNHELSAMCHRLSVDTLPGHRFDHGNFISCIHVRVSPNISTLNI